MTSLPVRNYTVGHIYDLIRLFRRRIRLFLGDALNNLPISSKNCYNIDTCMGRDKMRFKGKIGWLWWFVMASTTYSFYDMSNEFMQGGLFLKISSVLLVIIYFGLWYMTFKNYACIEDQSLIIYLGPFKQTIPIADILSIRKTHNPLSSMALSFDRLEIRARKTYVMISLKDKQGFADAMSRLNPNIEIKLS